ncbi:MAG: hypothetical protein ACLP3B_03780, partial [Syntrophobacteraceae bacterium]
SRIFLFFEQDFVYKLLFSQRSLRLCGELLFVFWLRLCCSRFLVFFVVKARIRVHPEKCAWPGRKNFPSYHSRLKAHRQ